MFNKPTFFLFLTAYLGLTAAPFSTWAQSKTFTVQSPDQKIQVKVDVGSTVQYQVAYDGKAILTPSPISLTLADGKVLGANAKVAGSPAPVTVNREVKPLYGFNSTIRDHYNELTINFKEKFALVFRAYNNGAAYRFKTSLPGKIRVKDEEASFRLSADDSAFFHPVTGFENSYESNYIHQKVSEFDSAQLATLPALLEVPNGPRVAIFEADLLDYAGLYLTQDEKHPHSLRGAFPKYPTQTQKGGFNNFNIQVKKRADYIAETVGTRAFPWRAIALVPADKDLLNNHLTYLLASEPKLADVSWIKPGKVAWDWWNSLNLSGVDFKTGFNTATYKYYIDFAAANGIEYVNLDEGWSDQFDLLKVTTALDMPEVLRYAKEKKVGLVLWCVWHTLDRQMNEALAQFEKWGIAGLKVDFMDRDDQIVVNFYERLATEAAKRKMLINFHGAFKPTGLERTYPNIINREAVLGLEYNKFSNKATPEHNVTIPFIRMLAGSMDYTPGAMTNANKNDFRVVSDRPMSQGTRCHQLAMYVVYYAPLQMISDAPTAYQREPNVLNFIGKVPTTWDETREIDGKVGDYVLMARRKGNAWYVGGMTDWSPRNLTLDLSFLGNGSYDIEIFSDGVNADRLGNDYVRTTRKVTSQDRLTLPMAAGGGWAARITPAK